MRAIRYYGPGDVRLDEIPEPQVGARQVKIKVGPFLLRPLPPLLIIPLSRSHGQFRPTLHIYRGLHELDRLGYRCRNGSM